MQRMRTESKEGKCAATSVLYWELSDADPAKCPVHGLVWAIKSDDLVVNVTADPEDVFDTELDVEVLKWIHPRKDGTLHVTNGLYAETITVEVAPSRVETVQGWSWWTRTCIASAWLIVAAVVYTLVAGAALGLPMYPWALPVLGIIVFAIPVLLASCFYPPTFGETAERID